MRILRLATVILFAAVTILFLIINIINFQSDNTLPEITIVGETLDVSLGADRTELMQGVTAYDANDGDITDKVIIESISRFVEPGVAIVKYTVCDNDNHVATASRKITYVDYISPRFTLSGSLVFNLTQKVNILSLLGAVDLIDGDISGKVIISAPEYTSNTAGVFYISAKASNSRGDMIYLELPIYIEDLSLSAPAINLREYLVYVKSDEYFDIGANLISATATDGTNLNDVIIIDTDYYPNASGLYANGVYQAHYYATDASGRRGHAILTLIVEE